MHMHPCRTGFCFKSTQPEKMCSLSRHTVGNLKSLWRFAVCNIRKVLLVFTRPALLASTRLDAVKQRSPSWMSFVLCASRCYDEVRRPTSLLFFVSLTVLRASSVQKCQVFANGLHQGFFESPLIFANEVFATRSKLSLNFLGNIDACLVIWIRLSIYAWPLIAGQLLVNKNDFRYDDSILRPLNRVKKSVQSCSLTYE
jgi:hypothetical protein